MAAKPKTQKASAQELVTSQLAAQKDARFQSAFRPLEKDAINELQTADQGKRAAMIAGRTNADINNSAAVLEAQQAGEHMGRGLSKESTMQDGFRRNIGTAFATNTGVVDASVQAQGSMDQDRLNVIKTGQGFARSTDSLAVNAARLANSKAQSILAAKSLTSTAKGNAWGQVAQAGVAGYVGSRSDALAKNPDGSPVIADNDLVGFAKTWKGRR